ncbi:VanW family protein [Prauserella muralis]|uniref:Vanomycin resistance protein VanB n=1 Tax=Prauserella muralis TaxID=588067 RepID=A0A2V4B940_9PSEU|nr:VanW family protein [Prauserella muralis]PXY31551.1 vanomycin resistance protein VanB [Prauserella muralis]TWE14098.1 vancomycin resistance protein YoaR [Prauserella muralis]
MREEHYWPEWDSDPAERKAAPQAFSAFPRTDDDELVDELLRPDVVRTPPPTSSTRMRRGIGRAFLLAGVAAVLFVVLYVTDLMVSLGDVPRGVSVAGVEVGGLSHSEAESRLRAELGPRLSEPIAVRAGDVRAQLSPEDAGLGLDWDGTLAQAGNQPLNPLTRVTSFFTSREVGVVTTSDDQQLRETLTGLADDEINHDVTEGDIGFHTLAGSGGTVRPYAVQPRQGQRLTDLDAAMAIVKDGWLGNGALELPVDVTPARATAEGVRRTLEGTVRPMVSGPIQVRGKDRDVVLRPADIADALRFTPRDDGALRVTLERGRLQDVLRPALSSTEQDPVSARITFAGGRPSIEPSKPGRQIDWERTFAPFVEIAGRTEDRELPVVYSTRTPDVTTKQARDLGIREVIGEFTTGGLSGAAAHNVATMAAAVNGALVRPGETFSLDGHTGARTSSQGYVEAPVGEDGSGRSVIGGGVSQFTTTLYNAAYFAGLKDAGHTPHRHYVDRYPLGRDAISLREDGSSVDLAFTNDLPKGVAVQASAEGSTVTVRIWGTKRYRVESSTGRRSDLRPAPVELERGPGCTPSQGALGFTVADTRTLYDVRTGRQVRTETREVTYEPRPAVLCRPGPPRD